MTPWQEANRLADKLYIPAHQRAQFLIDYMNNQSRQKVDQYLTSLREEDPDWMIEQDRREESEINKILRQSGIDPVVFHKYTFRKTKKTVKKSMKKGVKKSVRKSTKKSVKKGVKKASAMKKKSYKK